MAIQNGVRLVEYLGPATVAASPILGQWFDTTGCTQALGFALITNSTGATVVTLEYGTDGVTADADFTATTIVTGVVAAFVLVGPYARFRIVQTTADATKTKIYLQARN